MKTIHAQVSFVFRVPDAVKDYQSEAELLVRRANDALAAVGVGYDLLATDDDEVEIVDVFDSESGESVLVPEGGA